MLMNAWRNARARQGERVAELRLGRGRRHTHRRRRKRARTREREASGSLWAEARALLPALRTAWALETADWRRARRGETETGLRLRLRLDSHSQRAARSSRQRVVRSAARGC